MVERPVYTGPVGSSNLSRATMHQFGHHDSMALKWDIGTILLKNATLAIGTELMENGGEGVRKGHIPDSLRPS